VYPAQPDVDKYEMDNITSDTNREGPTESKDESVGSEKTFQSAGLGNQTHSSVFRKCQAVVCFLVGLLLIIFAASSAFVMKGESLGVILIVFAFTALLGWPLLVDGYHEFIGSGRAGWFAFIIGLLFSFGQIYMLNNWLTEMGAKYSDLLILPTYPSLFMPGLVVFCVGLLIAHFGWTGIPS